MSDDKVWEVYGDNTDPILITGRTIEPPIMGYQDTVKFSNGSKIRIQNCHIVGGSEDCIDMNRGCRDITVDSCELDSRGKYCMTIKDTERVTVVDTVILSHGSETDIDLGNWTDTSKARTKGVRLIGVTSADGRPVKVRVGHADWPQIIGGKCKIDYVGSFLLKAYWQLKSWGLIK